MDADGRRERNRPSGKSSADLLLQCRRRFKEVDAEARGLRTAIQLTRQVSSELELSNLLQSAMSAVLKLTAAERGYVVLKDEKGDLEVKVSHQFDRETVGEEGLSFSRSIVLHVIKTDEATLVTNASGDERFAEAASVKMMNLRAVMAAPIRDEEGRAVGAFYVDDPFTSGKFGKRALELLEAFANNVSVAIQTARLHDHIVKEKIREREMEVAREVQQRLVPRCAPEVENVETAWVYESASEVGGDLLQFPRFLDGSYGVFVADVMGKGVPAALVMAKIQQATKMVAERTSEPEVLLGTLNRTLCEDLGAGTMVTAVVALFEPGGGAVRLARAGHCPIGLVRGERMEFEWYQPPGLALGLTEEVWQSSDNETLELALDRGDGVLLFTDGVLEAMNEEREEYGLARIEAFARENLGACAGDFIERLVGDVRRFAGDAPRSDDMTAVYVRRKGDGQ